MYIPGITLSLLFHIPFIPYPFYSIPFCYGLNASNTRASPFFSCFVLPPYFPSFLTPQHMVSTMQTKPNKPLYIVCPRSFRVAFYGVFSIPSLSYPCPVYALFVFLCVHLFTNLYIILFSWVDLSILANHFYAYLPKLNFLLAHYILALYGQDISLIFHLLLCSILVFFAQSYFLYIPSYIPFCQNSLP